MMTNKERNWQKKFGSAIYNNEHNFFGKDGSYLLFFVSVFAVVIMLTLIKIDFSNKDVESVINAAKNASGFYVIYLMLKNILKHRLEIMKIQNDRIKAIDNINITVGIDGQLGLFGVSYNFYRQDVYSPNDLSEEIITWCIASKSVHQLTLPLYRN